MLNKSDINNVPIVSVIITNYNGLQWLKNCFDSILSQDYNNFEVMMVDNASQDSSVMYIKKNYPKVKVFINEKNIGYAQANNLGSVQAKGEILLFINNDIKAPKNLISTLVEYLLINNLDIIGPKILGYDGSNYFKDKRLAIDHFGYPGLSNKMFYLQGSAIMIRKKRFEELEGFDKTCFMYGEDIDLCWRARIAGLKISQCRETYIKHYGGGSSSSTLKQPGKRYIIPKFRRYELEKNALRNLIKNLSFFNLFYSLPGFTILNFLETLFYLIILNFKMAYLIQKAWWWNIFNLTDTIKERIKVQKTRIVSDKEIKKLMLSGSMKIKSFFEIGLPKFK